MCAYAPGRLLQHECIMPVSHWRPWKCLRGSSSTGDPSKHRQLPMAAVGVVGVPGAAYGMRYETGGPVSRFAARRILEETRQMGNGGGKGRGGGMPPERSANGDGGDSHMHIAGIGGSLAQEFCRLSLPPREPAATEASRFGRGEVEVGCAAPCRPVADAAAVAGSAQRTAHILIDTAGVQQPHNPQGVPAAPPRRSRLGVSNTSTRWVCVVVVGAALCFHVRSCTALLADAYVRRYIFPHHASRHRRSAPLARLT